MKSEERRHKMKQRAAQISRCTHVMLAEITNTRTQRVMLESMQRHATELSQLARKELRLRDQSNGTQR